MNDLKNILIAYLSTASSVFAAIEAPTVITIFSAIILPIMFFAIGKTVDVVLQIYLDTRKRGAISNADPTDEADKTDKKNIY